MAYTLHGAPLSPFVRKVMYLLNLFNTKYKLQIVMLGSVPDDFVNISPFKKVPVLQHDDWFQADSSIICHYLIESLGHDALTSLIPSTAELRAQVRWLEKFADYELAPRLTFTVFRQRIILPTSGKAADEGFIGRALEHQIPHLLDYLTNQLGTQTYFVGHCCSLAAIAITSQMINFMHAGEAIDHKKWPTLAAYIERMLRRSMWHTLVEREKVTLDKIRPKCVTL